ncbi:MAG TPA: hypothetical protein VLB27_10885, partial [candidate division Zixibacteria bacterium]|nr:hypothetical protein [candidate division Zixibacteria bacterium]
MERTQRLILVSALFVLALAPRFYILWTGSAQADDAFITYRYAESLAAGEGFVYNSGERVLGVTSPLYTLILALFALTGAAVPTVSLGLGLLASAVTATLLFFFCRRLRLGAGSYLAPALYAFWPLAIYTDVSGMETPLFTLAGLGFFYFVFIARYRSAALTAVVAALLRP